VEEVRTLAVMMRHGEKANVGIFRIGLAAYWPHMEPRTSDRSIPGRARPDRTFGLAGPAQQGYPDAWNTVERFARNYMDEGQLCDTRLLEKEVPTSYTPCAANQGMPARARGAFVGHGGPADFFCPEGRSGAAVQNCCGSHYPFGLHLIWEHVVTKEADGLHVNLSFSRDTPWCRVVSQQPYRGIVTVEMREPNNLLPERPSARPRPQRTPGTCSSFARLGTE
jgi:hypothetical protein